jgi:hypothetical protein
VADHPAFPAQRFYGLYAISPVTGLSCHRHSWFVSTNLAPASGRQDHAISPSAAAALVLHSLRVHRSPHSTYRDDAYVPLHEAGCIKGRHGFQRRKSEIFFAGYLNGEISLNPLDKLAVWRRRFRACFEASGATMWEKSNRFCPTGKSVCRHAPRFLPVISGDL